MPYIQLVTYRCADASFTGALKNLKTSAKIFRTWSKFQDISGQLLKFQEFRTMPRPVLNNEDATDEQTRTFSGHVSK